MKKLTLLPLLFAVILLRMPSQTAAATAHEEQQLISVLQSNASPADKDVACARLKRVGTTRSILALAALLTDEQLSHSARYALESNPSSKAGRALTEALAKTSGMTRIGIISSLGFRREAGAVSSLARLLSESDPDTAVAAARALGQVGTTKALKALERAPSDTSVRVQRAITDAWLRGAQQLLASGSESKALTIFQALFDANPDDTFRTAAFRGMILASGKKGLPLAVRAIVGRDPAAQTAALQLVREIKAPDATRTFAMLLNKVEPPLQTSLIEGLAQRNDPLAASYIASLVKSPDAQVRLSAINALGILGDDTMVPLLGVAAASSGGDEQKAARQALANLRRGNPAETLLRLLPEAKPEVQAEFARALGDRSDKSALPRLTQLAQEGSGSARKAALQALALLVEDAQVNQMVQFVLDSKTAQARADAADALNVALHNILARRGNVNVEPLILAFTTASTESRLALLPVCSSLIGPQVRSVLRTTVISSDPQIRIAGIRALCDTTDPDLLPDVLKLACDTPEENLRTLAIRACVRLTTQEESIKLPTQQKIEALNAILAKPIRAGQKRVVLAGLAEIPDPKALELAELMLGEPDVHLEAAQAVTRIATGLPYGQLATAKSALQKVITVAANADARKAAETALNDLQSGADYIVLWQAAGPFRRKGKDYDALLDIPFPPETIKSEEAKWVTLSLGPEEKRPWIMDLLKAFGGEHRVGYARTWVHSDIEQPARLEVGTDDGVKVWLDNVVVHTNNTYRALSPGSDKINVTLKAGWNPLLLKVTQLTAGWGFCAKFVKPDGSHLDGLRYAIQPKGPGG